MNKTKKLDSVDYSEYFEAYSQEAMGLLPKRAVRPVKATKTITKREVLEIIGNLLAVGSIFFFTMFIPLFAGVILDLLGR